MSSHGSFSPCHFGLIYLSGFCYAQILSTSICLEYMECVEFGLLSFISPVVHTVYESTEGQLFLGVKYMLSHIYIHIY